MRVAVLVVLALVAVSAMQVDDEASSPRRRRGPRYVQRATNDAGAKLVSPSVSGRRNRFPHSKPLVLVPRCDPRAYPTPEAHAKACAKPSSPIQMMPVTLPAVAPAVLPAVVPPALAVNVAATSVRPTLQSAAAAGPAGPSAANPGSCLSGFNPARLASTARTFQQSYASRGTRYSQPNRVFGQSVPYADCSSFVFSVMDAAGYGCLFNNARTTATMRPLQQARGGFHPTPRPGDIVMWTSHTGIVTDVAVGKVAMVAMGNSGCRYTGLIPLSSIAGWGSGTFLGYWTPRA